MATWRKTSRISSLVTPFLRAPLTCIFSSCGRLRQLIIARLSMLRILCGKPSRPHTAPQQYSVVSSCIGRLKSSAAAIDFSTYSAPSTDLRIARPFSNNSLFTNSPLIESRATPEPAARLCLLRFHIRADLHASPPFHTLHHIRHVRVGTLGHRRNRQQLPHRTTNDHRDAHSIGLLHAQPDVFIQQRQRKPEVERARNHTARNLILRSAVAPA